MSGRHLAPRPARRHRADRVPNPTLGVAAGTAAVAAVATTSLAMALTPAVQAEQGPANELSPQQVAAKSVVAKQGPARGVPVLKVSTTPAPVSVRAPVKLMAAQPQQPGSGAHSGPRSGRAADADTAVASDSTWVRPVPGARISSEYGARGALQTAGGATAAFHNGIDFAAPLGTDIHAVNDGVVVHVGFSDFDTHTGGIVVIKHVTSTSTYLTSYNHMAVPGILVKAGDQVSSGQMIAKVGNQGLTTGPHCHFSVREVTGPNTLKDWKLLAPRTFFSQMGF